MSASPTARIIRRQLQAEDLPGIVRIHEDVYGSGSQYGMNEEFILEVARNLDAAVASGWPHEHGAVWLIDGQDGGELGGVLALVREQPGRGRVRWYVLRPELRGQGLGRQMLEELVREARAQGLNHLELETFSALTAAGHLYRSVGFAVTGSSTRSDWGPPITHQRYELVLSGV